MEFAVLIDGNAMVHKVGRSVVCSLLKVIELSVGRKLPMDEVSLINGLWLEVKFTESEDFAALKGDTVLGVINISVEVKLNILVVLFKLLTGMYALRLVLVAARGSEKDGELLDSPSLSEGIMVEDFVSEVLVLKDGCRLRGCNEVSDGVVVTTLVGAL